MSFSFLLSLSLLSLSFLPVCDSLRDTDQDDLVVDLPGQPDGVTFKQYAGYITVDEANGRSIFYWFTESQSDPSTDPLIVWYQGGPGCSGLLAFLAENGPFLPNMSSPTGDQTLVVNPFAWNFNANTLYVDSPAGAGFSYSDTPTDYNTNNTQTAKDNYSFLSLWTQMYPQYATSALYLAGESYAGDYIPQLASLILEGPNDYLRMALSGLVLGNPTMSCPQWVRTRRDVIISMMYYHGLISLHGHNEWFHSGCPGTSENPSEKCTDLYRRIRGSAGKWDPDDVYENDCTGNGTLNQYDGVQPCHSLQDRRSTYLNTPSVQAAIHAKPKFWVTCEHSPILNFTTNYPNMVPYYTHILTDAPNVRVLFYSGDVDIATVPFPCLQMCVEEIGRPIIRSWRPWTIDGRTAGYLQQYEGFDVVTLKGGGHEAPQYTPFSAFTVLQRYLNGKYEE